MKTPMYKSRDFLRANHPQNSQFLLKLNQTTIIMKKDSRESRKQTNIINTEVLRIYLNKVFITTNPSLAMDQFVIGPEVLSPHSLPKNNIHDSKILAANQKFLRLHGIATFQGKNNVKKILVANHKPLNRHVIIIIQGKNNVKILAANHKPLNRHVIIVIQGKSSVKKILVASHKSLIHRVIIKAMQEKWKQVKITLMIITFQMWSEEVTDYTVSPVQVTFGSKVVKSGQNLRMMCQIRLIKPTSVKRKKYMSASSKRK